MFIADLFGWGVRCPECAARVSHAPWARQIIAILLWLVIPSFYAVFKALRVFHPELYFHPNVQTAVFIGRILIASVLFMCFFLPPICRRKEATNQQTAKKVRIVFLVAAGTWALLVLGWLFGGRRHGTEEYIFTEPLLMGLPELIVAAGITLAQNWTISGKLTGASVAISPNNSDVSHDSSYELWKILVAILFFPIGLIALSFRNEKPK